MTDYSDEWEYQRKCIEALKAVDTTDDTEWGYGLGGLVWVTPVEESYPKPAVLSPKEEQDRIWRLVEQYSRG
jgi:hypothetical protein